MAISGMTRYHAAIYQTVQNSGSRGIDPVVLMKKWVGRIGTGDDAAQVAGIIGELDSEGLIILHDGRYYTWDEWAD